MKTETPQAIVEIKPEVLTITSEAQKLSVTNHETSERAGQLLSAIKALRKQVAERIIKPAKVVKAAATKNVSDLIEAFDAPLEKAEYSIKDKVANYIRVQENLRYAEQNRLQLEANARAKKQAEDDALLMEAVDDHETAEAIREAPVVAPVVHVAPIAKPENIAMVANWKWRKLSNFDISKVPPEYLMLNEVMLNQLAKAMKSAMTQIPGIEAYDAGTIRVG